MNKPIFSNTILGSSLCSNLTTVVLDTYSRDQLAFALSHGLPHLPRLDTITGLDGTMTRALFGPGGMANVARTTFRSTGEASNAYVQAWRKFKVIALRIKKWEIMLDEEETEAFLSLDPSFKSNISSLSLWTPSDDGFPILESESSQFSELLSKLSSLSSLTICKGVVMKDDQFYRSPLSNSAISTSYLFRNTLTSFNFSGSVHRTWVDYAFIQFLSRCPSLRYLRIEAACYDPSLAPKVTLRSLTDLELVGPKPGILDCILHELKLPKLVNFTLDCLDFGGSNAPLENLENLYYRFCVGFPTLRHVYLMSREGGLHRDGTDFLRNLCASDDFTLHTLWQPGEAESEAAATSTRSTWQGTELLTKEEILGGLIDGVDRLNHWVMEEAMRVSRSGDLTNARHLFETMASVQELKEFRRD